MSKYNWDFLGRLYGQDSHKLFYSLEEHRFSIADNSGRFPQDTDDGVLWINPSRSIVIGRVEDTPWHLDVRIPVTRDGYADRDCTFMTTIFGLHQLLKRMLSVSPHPLNFDVRFTDKVSDEIKDTVRDLLSTVEFKQKSVRVAE